MPAFERRSAPLKHRHDASEIDNLPSSVGAIAALTARVTATEGDIDTAQAEIDTLQSDVLVLQGVTPVLSVTAGSIVSATGGGGGTVDSVVAGTNIDVDATDPANPIVGLDATAVTDLGLAATAVQPGDLATVATTGAYSDLTGTPAAITPAALTKTDDTNVTATLGGTPATALLQAASITLGWTGTLAVSRGGSGAGTLTGYLKGNGTSAFTASATIPYSDLTGTPSIPSAANPSGSIGLSAVNGSAGTFMRSDGHPALDQSIAPTWTGIHTHSDAVRLTGVSGSEPYINVGSAYSANGTFTPLFHLYGSVPIFSVKDSTNAAEMIFGASSTATFAGAFTDHEFQIRQNNVTMMKFLAANGGISGRGPVIGATLSDMTPDHGSYTGTLTGCTTSPTATIKWVRQGNIVTLFIPALTGTSNSTACTITGSMPASIQPATTQNLACAGVEDNSVFTAPGLVRVTASSSTISLGKNGALTMTNGGTKGMGAASTVTYLLT